MQITKENVYDAMVDDFKQKFGFALMSPEGTREFVDTLTAKFPPDILRAMWNAYLRDDSEQTSGVTFQMFGLPRRLNKYAMEAYRKKGEQSKDKRSKKKTGSTLCTGAGYRCEFTHPYRDTFVTYDTPQSEEKETLECQICGGTLYHNTHIVRDGSGRSYSDWENSMAKEKVLTWMAAGTFRKHSILNMWAQMAVQYGGGGLSHSPFEYVSRETSEAPDREPDRTATRSKSLSNITADLFSDRDDLDENFL